MKLILFLFFISILAGCHKVSNMTQGRVTNATPTGDQVYDSQSEMKVLVPWDIWI